jgi:hypothetical protein
MRDRCEHIDKKLEAYANGLIELAAYQRQNLTKEREMLRADLAEIERQAQHAMEQVLAR